MNMFPSPSNLRDEKHQELQTRCSLKGTVTVLVNGTVRLFFLQSNYASLDQLCKIQ